MKLGRLALMSLLLIAAIWIFAVYRAQPLVHISGDLSASIRDSLNNEVGPDALTADPNESALTVVSVTDWEKLAFVPGATDLCSDLCREPFRVVRILEVGFLGLRKSVFINIEPFLDTADSDTFSFTQAGQVCAIAGIRSEIANIRNAAWPQECISADQTLSRWRLSLF